MNAAFAFLAVFFFAVRYREREKYATPDEMHGSIMLETVWSVIPFIISMTIFLAGAYVYYDQYRIPDDPAMEVYVVGKQWMWKLQHATGQREINQLHVPVGRKVKLIMTSEDVIHDVFIPAFRTKADVVPGRTAARANAPAIVSLTFRDIFTSQRLHDEPR